MMKKARVFLLLLLLLVFAPSPAPAGTLSLEAGQGFHQSTHSDSVFLRYQIPAFELLGFDTYYEAMLGAWSGKNNRNEAGALSLGITLPWHTDDWFFGSAGLARISRTTDNLGTLFQFTFHVGYTKKVGAVNLSIGYVHFSNGKYFFGWSGPNYGENFYALQAGLAF